MVATTQPLLRSPEPLIDGLSLWPKVCRFGMPWHANEELTQKVIGPNLTNLFGIPELERIFSPIRASNAQGKTMHGSGSAMARPGGGIALAVTLAATEA